MRPTSQRDRNKFELLIEQHIPIDKKYLGSEFARRLMRYGATLGRLAEEQCNGYQLPDGREDTRRAEASDKKEASIRAKVESLCAEFGCNAVFQGDPRGYVLKIATPDGYTNDWGREGICVPTS